MSAAQRADPGAARSAYTRQIAFDPDTGAMTGIVVQEEELRRAQGRSKKSFSTPFAVVFLQAAELLAANTELTASDHRVLWALIARSSQETPLVDSGPTEMGRRIGMHRGQVYRALARLAELDLIIRPRRGKVIVNPALTWRGTAEQRARWIREREMEQS